MIIKISKTTKIIREIIIMVQIGRRRVVIKIRIKITEKIIIIREMDLRKLNGCKSNNDITYI